MAVGRSNRIVIDVPPGLKQRLYAALMAEGRSLREWFLEAANRHIERHETGQRDLPLAAEPEEPVRRGVR